MNLAKTGLLSLISTAIKMMSALVINKFIAVYIGPTGLTFIGQMQNFTQIALTLAQGAINNGVVKYTAEKSDDPQYLESLFSTSIRISLFCSVLVSLVLFYGSSYFSDYVFKSANYIFVFKFFSLTIFLYVINSLLLSILNGLKEIGKYITINIVQSLVSLIFSSSLIYFWGLEGALIALVTNQSIVLFISIFLLRKHSVINFSFFKKRFDKNILKNLTGFTLMALVSICVVPVTQILIRDSITVNLGTDNAGLWQAMTYISNMYLMVVTTALSVYYLPKLSELKTNLQIREEIVNAFKVVIPVVSVVGIMIYFLRDLILVILFSEDFYRASELFMYQILGDILKISGWIFGMLLSAKAQTTRHIFTQVVFSLLLYFSTVFYIDLLGLKGSVVAYAFTYALFLPYIAYITRGFYANR